jgi:hypothetical protein
MTAAPAPTQGDLPPRGGPEPVHAALARELRAFPGHWQLLGSNMPRSTAHHIQIGRYAAFRPAGAFEARVRNSRGTRGDVWVRFRGKRRGP